MSNSKRAAGRKAAERVQSGQIVGLGTGSTVFYTLERLGERVRDDGLELRGIPTSTDTESKAREFGIPLMTLDELEGRIDLTIDGADEINADFHMIKGGGGALLREKVVASLSREVTIIVHAEKVVADLGAAFPLPVELVPFARTPVRRALQALGAEPLLRVDQHGNPFLTDNGNEILDCAFEGGIADPAALSLALAGIPGVVESGLFLDLCDHLVIGLADGGIEERSRAQPARN
ncbi:MAG: ribose-5-phosphate isomerase RpiA [Planctomycetota bacterium]|nr:ribose-5-phosphate isomerase RpiA [Planctomycetota bacterium]